MWLRLAYLSLVVSVTGCKFPYPDSIDGGDADDGATDATDATDVDASPPCTPDTIVCDAATDVYIDCSSIGTVEVRLDCPLGCDAVEEKCVDIDPSNGVANFLDMARDRSDVPSVTFSGASTIDGGGMVFNGATSIVVPSATLAGIRVYMFKQLTVPAGATLKGRGTTSLILVSDGPVLIEGTIDMSADGDLPGPGSGGSLACQGGNTAVNAAMPAPGAGGGAAVSAGARGGGTGAVMGGTAGVVDNGGTSVPLVGGCPGGLTLTGGAPSFGGGGGGAIQIVSRSSITIRNAGKVDASGGGGRSTGASLLGGGGGGGGGVVFLEAPQIVLDGPGVELSAKGGAGAAAGTGLPAHQGADGGTAAAPAAGGTNSGQAAGGDGSTFSGVTLVPPMVGGTGAAGQPGGGGGGGAGLVHARTVSGAINPQNGAQIRAHRAVNAIATRLVP